jgi:lipoprotein-anchoring transpeptidase ErfK/SrfK
MRSGYVIGLLVCLCLAAWPAGPVQATGEEVYVVQPGDTLLTIAARYGLSASQLAAANNLQWNSWVYVGQQLVIPASVLPPPVVDLGEGDWIEIRPGWYGVPQPLVATASDTAAPPAPVPEPLPVASSGGEKWIDVNLTTQTLTAYEGQTPVFSALVSSGLPYYPTVTGTFAIYVKYTAARMRGGYGLDAYDLPNVPYVMYFYKGYGLHGTYCHNNFGTPMSHGCVNLATPDAEWLFNWAAVGTTVVTHY